MIISCHHSTYMLTTELHKVLNLILNQFKTASICINGCEDLFIMVRKRATHNNWVISEIFYSKELQTYIAVFICTICTRVQIVHMNTALNFTALTV